MKTYDAEDNTLSLNNINAALLNASTMLKDNQDGIDAQIRREEFHSNKKQITLNKRPNKLAL